MQVDFDVSDINTAGWNNKRVTDSQFKLCD